MTLLLLPSELGGLAALYMVYRERREDVLDLDTRRRLYENVETYPGLHLSELARACGIETNHAKYHLEYLESRGLVASQRDAGYTRWYPRMEGPQGLRDVVGAREKEILAMLRRPIPLHVTLLLLDREFATHVEMLPLVGVAHGTLHYHLKNMERIGLLESSKAGRERRYRLAQRDALFALLLRYKPPDRLVQGFLTAWDDLSL